MSRDSADVVVIGAGHNGLVAAAMLADAGWDVLVLEAQPEPGGAVKSAELFPGYVSDLFSAFYPLSVASPALRALNLDDHGLQWTHAPAVVGHARSAEDDDAPVIYREIDRTAADLERRNRGDGDRWRALFDQWLQIKDAVLSTLFSPFPPVRGPLQLLRALGTADALRLAHLLLLPADVMAEQLFDGEAARLLLLGNAMHADAPIDAPGSGVMGYLLIMMAQDGGFPVPCRRGRPVDRCTGQSGLLGRSSHRVRATRRSNRGSRGTRRRSPDHEWYHGAYTPCRHRRHVGATVV